MLSQFIWIGRDKFPLACTKFRLKTVKTVRIIAINERQNEAKEKNKPNDNKKNA